MNVFSEPSEAAREMTTAPVHTKAAAAVAVIIVTYNSAAVLPGLLDSLSSGLEGIDRYEVIVVDNDSHDLSAEIAEQHSVKAKVIRMGRNAGYAAGINAATDLIAAESDILILNPDIRLSKGCMHHLYKRLRGDKVGIAVPQILNEDGTIAKSLRREPSLLTVWADSLLGSKIAASLGLGEIVATPQLYRRGGAVEWATGAALAVSGLARRTVGLWDESFFLYSEEVDYMERARRAGLQITYEARARAVHIGGEYHANPYLSALMTANRIHYYRRHHGPLATMLFRLAIVVGETMRFALGPGHRAALWAALSR